MPRSVRLTFTYDGDDVQLVSRQAVDVVPPGSEPVAEGSAGFWLEMRSDQDEAVHRVVMEDPLRPDVEVFSSEPGRSVSRARVERPSGSFSVLVPDLAEASAVTIHSSSAPRARQMLADRGEPRVVAVEIARFPLRDTP